jgi:3',5'-cyclic AMP phosphodiesterase CpdA
MDMHNESSTPYLLRILHISDLHERGQRESESWRRRCVLGPAWEQNLGQILDDGPIDLVCFTGDAADWGLAEEYQAATDRFIELLKRIRLSPDRLFLVPGNHDVHRQTQRKAWLALRNALAGGVHELALSRWMAGLSEPPPGFKQTWRKAIIDRQAAYRAWLKGDLAHHGLSPELSHHDGLGYRATVTLPGHPFPIHLIGLDTAWLAGDNNDSGRLRLTDNQIMRHATDADGKPLAGLRLALMHHPLTDLTDGAQCRLRLAEHVDLVLRGHLHETEVQTWADPDRRIRQLAAGCLYEGHRADQYPNALRAHDPASKCSRATGAHRSALSRLVAQRALVR